jgi:hypothetical protein
VLGASDGAMAGGRLKWHMLGGQRALVVKLAHISMFAVFCESVAR